MKKKYNIVLIILLLSVLFQYCFWHNNLGMNLILFLSALAVAVAAFKDDLKITKEIKALGVISLLSLLCVLGTNTLLSKITFLLCITITAGYIQKPLIRSAYMAAFQQIQSFFTAPVRLINYIEKNSEANWSKPVYYIRLTILPLLIFFIFLALYMGGSSHFFLLVSDYSEILTNYFAELFQHFSFGQILFFLFGVIVISSVLIPDLFVKLVLTDLQSKTQLYRKRPPKPESLVTSPIGLKNELKIAVLLILLLNILLVVVNITDIKWVWLNYSGKQAWELSQYVHQGTWMLVASIFLSMAIVLFFFRGNLNFIAGNKKLKTLTVIWIVQNMLLLISVGIRNYQYINNFGLAYKRIGVIMFLLATIVGLFTMIIKIRKRKSSIYLLRTNTLTAIIICLCFSAVPWDPVIASYNLSNSKEKDVDLAFLLSLSDKALPVLAEHKELISKHYWKPGSRINQRIDNFILEWENQSWQSWNFADYKTYKFLKKQSDI